MYITVLWFLTSLVLQKLKNYISSACNFVQHSLYCVGQPTFLECFRMFQLEAGISKPLKVQAKFRGQNDRMTE